jgi:hypothetical protein
MVKQAGLFAENFIIATDPVIDSCLVSQTAYIDSMFVPVCLIFTKSCVVISLGLRLHVMAT